MKHKPILGSRFFFATSPLPCPYLPDRLERRIVTELVGGNASSLHDALAMAGYRRSHGIVYAPACQGCEACMAVRVIASEFRSSRSHRRILRRNAGVLAKEASAIATQEQFELFAAYQQSRHVGGDMASMDFIDYRTLVEDTPVKTRVIEFRDPGGHLVGACLTDWIKNGLSAVYSIFDPEQSRRSLGIYMILWLIERARELGLRHVYLGYWIAECSKMSYKASFQPLEIYVSGVWRPFLTERDH